VLAWVLSSTNDPNLWLTLGGGALRIGADIIGEHRSTVLRLAREITDCPIREAETAKAHRG